MPYNCVYTISWFSFSSFLGKLNLVEKFSHLLMNSDMSLYLIAQMSTSFLGFLQWRKDLLRAAYGWLQPLTVYFLLKPGLLKLKDKYRYMHLLMYSLPNILCVAYVNQKPVITSFILPSKVTYMNWITPLTFINKAKTVCMYYPLLYLCKSDASRANYFVAYSFSACQRQGFGMKPNRIIAQWIYQNMLILLVLKVNCKRILNFFFW